MPVPHDPFRGHERGAAQPRKRAKKAAKKATSRKRTAAKRTTAKKTAAKKATATKATSRAKPTSTVQQRKATT